MTKAVFGREFNTSGLCNPQLYSTVMREALIDIVFSKNHTETDTPYEEDNLSAKLVYTHIPFFID